MRIILLIVCFAVSETIPARVDRSCGGKKISINDARYIVSIQKNGVHNCCGALITWQHVLTAASCIIDVLHKPLFHLTVATGPKSKYAWRYQHAIKNASFHPRFEDEYRMNLHYDLAVLTLSELVPDNDMPLPILLPNELPDQFAKGLFITFDQNPKVPRNGYLYKLPVVIYYLNQSTTDQAGDDPKWYSAFKGIMEDGDSSDVGDTGGPLVYNDTVIGIAAAMLTNRGRVFINVAACADFISKAIWEN